MSTHLGLTAGIAEQMARYQNGKIATRGRNRQQFRHGTRGQSMTNNASHLTQIIASVWGDPTDITDAVWQAGYRKPERGEKEIAVLTIDVMNGIPDEVPYSERPRNLGDILTTELYTIILEATLSDLATPAMVAKMILWNGYRKGDGK
ncbi:hypothetical protein ABLB69_09680 [Xenorhabdus khoisanae]